MYTINETALKRAGLAVFARKDFKGSDRTAEEIARTAIIAYGAGGGLECDEAVAWETTTLGYVRFVTDSHYRKFSPEVRRWYKPYRCSNCTQASASAGGNGV